MIQKEKAYEASDLQLFGDLETQKAPSQGKNILVKDLEGEIMKIVSSQEEKEIQNQPYLKLLTQDLEILLDNLQLSINHSPQQILQTRMHQLAIAKILVFTHGKSDFRLVAAHFSLGRAYLESNCYEQAVSHLTIASTKVSKMGDIKETKIYNSYILTALARCYLALDGYSHSLELLTRAYDIQSNNQNIKGSSLAEETLELLARVYLNMKMPKDAIRITDKLIDILKAQFSDYESIFKKLTQLSKKYRLQDQVALRIEAIRKKGGDYLELIKPFETLTEKLEYLIAEYDRKWLRDLLPNILKQVQVIVREPETFQEVLFHVEGITSVLVRELKRMMIFKFRVYLEGDGEYLTDSIDQDLKKFLREYYQEVGEHAFRVLTQSQLVDVYKLLVHYCMRFSDHDTQLQYLNNLQTILEEEDQAPPQQLQLLKVKRNISMIYNQKRIVPQTISILTTIRQLQRELFGRSSEAVKKTSGMIKVVEEEGRGFCYMKPYKHDKNVSVTRKLIL